MYKFIFIFFIFFSYVHAQNTNQSIVGDWTKVKEEAIDGSKNISARYGRSTYWHISTTKISMKNDPVHGYIKKNAIDYIKDGNHISTSPESGYNILKLTSDSLIVVENIKGKIDKDKVQKMWFVKTSKIASDYKEKHKQDSVLVAIPTYAPIIRKKFIEEVNSALGKNNLLTNFSIKGNFLISPKKRKVQLLSNDSKIIKNKNFQVVQEIAENTFANWDLTNFENFESIYIPYLLESKVLKTSDGTTFKTIDINFFPDSNESLSSTEPTMEDLELAQKHLQKAVNFLQTKKYDKAVEFFNKGFDLDPTKVDALYNIVSIYSFLKDKNKMCLTLKKLKDLEQTDGTKLYNQFCAP